MAESVVYFLVQNIGVLLEKEGKQFGRGIRGKIVGLRDELELMKAFLREADDKEDDDETIRSWVAKVIELAYEAEDILDDFLLTFEHPTPREGFKPLSKIARVLKTLKARRRVARGLNRAKSAAVQISEQRRGHEYWNSSQRNSRGSSAISSQSRSEQRIALPRIPHYQPVSVAETELVSWLLEDAEVCHGVRVLGVHGTSGIGKTTLVTKIYGDARVKQRFSIRAWLYIDPTFEEHEVLLNIIKVLKFKRFEQPIHEETYPNDVPSLKDCIQSLLHEHKFLVVLDDVCLKSTWEFLKPAFPENDSGSCVIVTTRHLHLADFVTKDSAGGKVFEVKPLTETESWDFFCQRVFQGQPCPKHLEEESRLILQGCLGNPLAIATVGGILASSSTTAEWIIVRKALLGETSNNSIERAISLSFNYLSYDLKSCLMYLGMFPENHYYFKKHIVQLWIAEGFIEQRRNATLEELADACFTSLLESCLILMVEENTYGEDNCRFQVHNLVRDVILEKSVSHNFAATTNQQKLIVPGKARRLSVGTSLMALQGDRDFSRLRSLIFLCSEDSITNSKSVSEFLTNRGVRLLKVLDCSGFDNLDSFPKFIITQFNLTYLNLSSTRVASIPPSIAGLRKLEVLNLKNTLVEELPAEILQLHCLRHLIAYRKIHSSYEDGVCRKVHGLRHLMACHEIDQHALTMTSFIGVKVPTGIDALTSLQTLLIIQVTQPIRSDEVDLIRSLGRMRQLRKLQIQQLREEHGPILCSSIEQMSHLCKLEIESRENDEILDVQHMSSPPSSLEIVAMHGRLLQLPSWLSSNRLETLARLSLRWSKLTVDPLNSLQALPGLEVLEFIDEAYEGDKLRFGAGAFQMLKILRIHNLRRLRGVTIEEGAMPRLEYLALTNCKSLNVVPSGIEFLENLRSIRFTNMSGHFVKRLRPSTDQDSDFERIKHVPSLFVGSLNAEERLEPYP